MEIPLSGMALNSGHSRHRPTGALNADIVAKVFLG
jgi:hypothetical protein